MDSHNTETPLASVSRYQTCPQCHQQIAASFKFCLLCGTKLIDRQPVPVASGTRPLFADTQSLYDTTYQAAPSVDGTVLVKQRMLTVSRGMRLIGALLFLLFFSPFVSCSDLGFFRQEAVEITGAQVASSPFIATVQGQNSNKNSEDFLFLLMFIQPLAGILLYLRGGRLQGQLDFRSTMIDDTNTVQFVLIGCLCMLCGFFLAIKLNSAAIFFEFEWGYKTSFVTTISGITVTRMWNTALRQLQSIGSP